MSENCPTGISTIDGVETLRMSRLDRASFSILDYLGQHENAVKTMRMDPATVEGISGYIWAQSKFDDASGDVTLSISFEPRASIDSREIYYWSANHAGKRVASLGKVTMKSWLKSKLAQRGKQNIDFGAQELERIERLALAANSINRTSKEATNG